ncbi:predicted protein [Histoplasma mississippiense (nom. inval.)]|uniref:predicted protein n=1 Tax=Ajellomyces capsulatus (strain NAm1 / WU24) TaxID=2059318 RepID=UPI000157D662|nr:predicted protein [Histoplasma mississippiense (nom. inval.)]EDN05344.1 predicted protein [Histoplasma mississippiense (nom. inval.)]
MTTRNAQHEKLGNNRGAQIVGEHTQPGSLSALRGRGHQAGPVQHTWKDPVGLWSQKHKMGGRWCKPEEIKGYPLGNQRAKEEDQADPRGFCKQAKPREEL